MEHLKEKRAEGVPLDAQHDGESYVEFYKRCWGPQGLEPTTPAVCTGGQDGCTKERDVCWMYDPYAYDLANEYIWGWFCGECLYQWGIVFRKCTTI